MVDVIEEQAADTTTEAQGADVATEAPEGTPRLAHPSRTRRKLRRMRWW